MVVQYFFLFLFNGCTFIHLTHIQQIEISFLSLLECGCLLRLSPSPSHSFPTPTLSLPHSPFVSTPFLSSSLSLSPSPFQPNCFPPLPPQLFEDSCFTCCPLVATPLLILFFFFLPSLSHLSFKKKIENLIPFFPLLYSFPLPHFLICSPSFYLLTAYAFLFLSFFSVAFLAPPC